jgi:hypothetical protein
MPHDSANPNYGVKVLAKASFCPDFSVEAVKLRVIDMGRSDYSDLLAVAFLKIMRK